VKPCDAKFHLFKTNLIVLFV